MAPGSILSTKIPSDKSQYELYEFWFNKIDHIHTYGAAKVNIVFPGYSMVGFSVGFQVVWHCHFFQMAPGSILSTQISSDRSQYDVYKVSSQKIGWKVSIEHVKHQKWFTLLEEMITTLLSSSIQR